VQVEQINAKSNQSHINTGAIIHSADTFLYILIFNLYLMPTPSHNIPQTPSVHIQLQKITKKYTESSTDTEGKKELLVLDQVNQSFFRGEFICVLGKSGSGKSTLLNLISGIDIPSSGEVLFHEGNRVVSISQLSENDRTLFRRQHIGIVFQFFNLIPTLNVLENVTLPLELNNIVSPEAAVMLLDRMGLGDRLQTSPDKLSGGEQQRVAIARALAHDPSIILADEPTGNLDGETGKLVLSLLLESVREAGHTLILVTHDQKIAKSADRIFFAGSGQLSQIDSPR